MKTPQQVTADVERRLARTWTGALTSAGADGERDAWPHAFPIGQPGSATLAEDFAAVATQATLWRSWATAHELELRFASRRVLGTSQQLPTHVVVTGVDVAAALCEGLWLDRLSRGRRRAAVLGKRYGHLTDPARILGALDSLGDVDFDLLCRAADWFARNDATGLTARQVPIEGLHSKWLNSHRQLVRELAGVADLGLLADHPARIHFTYLDPEYRAGTGRLHDSATVGDAFFPAYRPRVVLISENKDTAIHFPPLEGGISVEGVGRGGVTAAAFDWLAGAPAVFYWGDMDADGLEILDGFRAAGIPARSILMDPETYACWEQFGTNSDVRGRPLQPRAPRPVPHLNAGELRLYHQLVDPAWARYRRIEQERIPVAVALAAVRRLTGDAAPGRSPAEHAGGSGRG